MSQVETMALDEKFAIARKACERLDMGDREGYSRLIRSVPMPSYLAKVARTKNKKGVPLMKRA